MSFELKYIWEPLKDSTGNPYRFPSRIQNYLPSRHDRPGVYRWGIIPASGGDTVPQEILIGESGSLVRRLGEYVRPTTSAEEEWNLKFNSMTKAGYIIECRLLQFESFELASSRVSMEDQSNPFVRKLLENLLLIVESAGPWRILNKKRELKTTLAAGNAPAVANERAKRLRQLKIESLKKQIAELTGKA